ncbi:phage tail tape measure protein [Pelotomaculum terephthalicicum JT]|uniref:phage tail tape measure protein n=1 Tax=Pelotomaculum TaxID=191373 RepID=UPI0009D2B14D|nr:MULTISPECIES: phage tail tape measure protein [Pelotomaculum]MCG9966875.1 phage tail tape measure protein [Pelotomaculum terephthalicicum JT]OPX87980.1 MAG: Phage-related minor tail protein [Pelotomaculum sp. PtaB.Bin117]OPY61392.1 MAG: Phage-related minor tail protein [Pelotomaculum sp. PtaU1.Bin065]
MSTVLDLAIAISVTDFATSGVKNIISQFSLLQSATDETKKKMDSLKNFAWGGGIAAAIGTAGVLVTTTIGTEAVKQAANLQEVMTEIKAQFGKDITDLSKYDEVAAKMEEIKDLSNRLGLQTTFSNIGVGQAILELQKGGIDYQNIVNGAAEATVKFAQLNKMAPEAAAELMVQARAGFQLTGQQMLDTADIITKVAAASSAEAVDIQRGLGNMAGVAAQMWGTRSKNEQVLDSSILVTLQEHRHLRGERRELMLGIS